MQDDQLLSDLRAIGPEFHQETAKKLEQNGIRSYARLLALLQEESADAEVRANACWVLGVLRSKFDGRRITPIVLKLLATTNGDLRRTAMRTLGMFQSKRAVKPLLNLLVDNKESIFDRIEAIYALTMIRDDRIDPVLQGIMFDLNEDVRLRALAIEWSPRYEGMLDTWIGFLSDPLPDLRFWAAYRLSQTWIDIHPALAALDQVAAYDHTLPQTWGWHIDREALRPLEEIYSYPYRLEEYGNDENGLPSYHFYLLSPASEYDTFDKQFRRYNPDSFYDALPAQPIDLTIDPDWLRNEILQAWPSVKFDIRQPKPQTYVLDWHLQIDGQNLLGGLHRDQYALVLSGKDDASLTFAAWYRSIIAPQHKLYIYEWADAGIELTPAITATQISQAVEDLHEARSAPVVLAKLSQTEANE